MANHEAVIDLMNDNARLMRAVDLLEQNAGIQAKLLADTGRQRDTLVKALATAEDVLSRAPFSTAIWPNGMHPNTGIEQIRQVLADVGGEKL